MLITWGRGLHGRSLHGDYMDVHGDYMDVHYMEAFITLNLMLICIVTINFADNSILSLVGVKTLGKNGISVSQELKIAQSLLTPCWKALVA